MFRSLGCSASRVGLVDNPVRWRGRFQGSALVGQPAGRTCYPGHMSR